MLRKLQKSPEPGWCSCQAAVCRFQSSRGIAMRVAGSPFHSTLNPAFPARYVSSSRFPPCARRRHPGPRTPASGRHRPHPRPRSHPDYIQNQWIGSFPYVQTIGRARHAGRGIGRRGRAALPLGCIFYVSRLPFSWPPDYIRTACHIPVYPSNLHGGRPGARRGHRGGVRAGGIARVELYKSLPFRPGCVAGD